LIVQEKRIHHGADQKEKATSLPCLAFLVIRSANELALAIICEFNSNVEHQVGQVVESALWSFPSVFIFTGLVFI